MGERKTIWEQLVDQKDRWIGGTLTEYFIDKEIVTHSTPDDGKVEELVITENKVTSIITDLKIEKCIEYTCFRVEDKDGGCMFNIKYGGVVSGKNTLNFHCHDLNFGIDPKE